MVFFERCVKSVSLIGDSVDRTAETQGTTAEYLIQDRKEREQHCFYTIGNFISYRIKTSGGSHSRAR